MKKVMILGAALGQVPFIEICKSRGYTVLVVSPQGDYPGFRIADKSYFLDSRDKEGILKIAQMEKIDAIMSDQTDVSIPSVAYVSEKLGLKSIGYETSKYFSNKYFMREKARAVGIDVPDFRRATTLQEAKAALAEIGFPAMIKPVDSSGSRGVYKISSLGELEKHFDYAISFSADKSIIVEQFIRGTEYIANGVALDFQYINTDLGIKEQFDKKGQFISSMCMFISTPLVTNPLEQAVLDVNKRLVEKFCLPFGITHGEYIVSSEDKKVYLVEIAARGGGVFLSSDLTLQACGINTNELLIDYVVEDKSAQLNKLLPTKGVAAYKCFELKPGVIKNIINKEKLSDIQGVFKVFLDDLYVGKTVDEMLNDASKLGPILIKAKTRAECYQIIETIKNTFYITVDSSGVETDIVW